MENTYEQAKKNAIEKVFLKISETGSPTKEQLDFLNFCKDKKKESINDIAKEVNSIEKIFDMMFAFGGQNK